jgi:hypothetical protein
VEVESSSDPADLSLRGWENTDPLYVVEKVGDSFVEGKNYYIFSNEGKGYVSASETKPLSDTIYFVSKTPDYIPYVVCSFYRERKLCIIGSDSMVSPFRAHSGKLNSKVNGENSLTFSIYYKVWDETRGDFVRNPFLGKLVNERKVKLRKGAIGSEDCKWYDFVIKSI